MRISEPFYLGKYELTQAQWEALMGANPSFFRGQPSLPVEKVSWEDVESFLAALNRVSERDGMTFALPTEAQWEYACRAGTTTFWHFGDEAASIGEYDWSSANADEKTHPVGRLKANAFGRYDMHGNVLEWYNGMPTGITPPTTPVRLPINLPDRRQVGDASCAAGVGRPARGNAAQRIGCLRPRRTASPPWASA